MQSNVVYAYEAVASQVWVGRVRAVLLSQNAHSESQQSYGGLHGGSFCRAEELPSEEDVIAVLYPDIDAADDESTNLLGIDTCHALWLVRRTELDAELISRLCCYVDFLKCLVSCMVCDFNFVSCHFGQCF